MISTDLFADVQRQMAEDFQSQNPELFDTVFEVEGRKLYAHKYHLSLVSPTFKTMLSDRWNTNKNEAITINGYGYESFKDLLSFIYSGQCNLADVNIFTMLDMAEFYQIEHLKALCDEYLSKMEIDISNVFQLLDISSKYSLTQTKESIRVYLILSFSKVIKSNEFLEADKSLIEELVTYASKSFIKREKLFQAVYQWAEHQAIRQQEQSSNEIFNMNDAIKAEIAPFLSSLEFKKMQLDFLNTFVVQRGFLFSDDELTDILNNAKPEPVISDSLRYIIYGPFDGTSPIRQHSAYMCWLSENYARLSKLGMSFTRAAGIEWGQLEDKTMWERLAADDKKRYEREMAEYMKQ